MKPQQPRKMNRKRRVMELQYLVPKRAKRATHIWTGLDTACRMVSTGGLRATHKYDLVADAAKHRNHKRICAMCNNNANKWGLFVHHNDAKIAKELSWL